MFQLSGFYRIASCNDVTLNPSWRGEYTRMGRNSGRGIVATCPSLGSKPECSTGTLASGVVVKEFEAKLP